LGILQEQKADGYLRGQIWNRESEGIVLPQLEIRCDNNWAEVGESVSFVVRRRFKLGKRGRQNRGLLKVKILVSGSGTNFAGQEVEIPSGDGSITIVVPATVPGGFSISIQPDRAYAIDSAESSGHCSVVDLTPYVVTWYDHKRFAYADLHRAKWGLINNSWWFRWWGSLNDPGILTPSIAPVGPPPADNQFQPFANWNETYEWIQRFVTPVSIARTTSAAEPSWDTPAPNIDPAIYGFIYGVTVTPAGVPCPPFVPPYNIGEGAGHNYNQAQVYQPGANLGLYPAPDIGSQLTEQACWIYYWRSINFPWFSSYTTTDETITPPPPAGDKIKQLWQEDDGWIF
jgi:hypothetical protein